MRNFIDLVNKAILVESPTGDNLLTLLEAKHYEAMFAALENLGNRYQQDTILETVAEVKGLLKTLRRSDRQAWAGRILRCWMIDNIAKWNFSMFDHGVAGDRHDDAMKLKKAEAFNQFQSEVSRLSGKYMGEYAKTTGVEWGSDSPQNPKDLIKRMIIGHYLGMPFSKIQNYAFTNQSIQTVVTDLARLENEFKERTKALLPLIGEDRIILKLPNDFCWVMLDRGYCGEEANAMGHCGNAGARNDDRILSLRRVKDVIDGKQYFEVFLTFILNGDGYLGEMKGRNNDKPVQRYHDAIIALLKLPIIKGMRGGGYKPQNNFNIGDLTPEQQDELLDTHPHLGNWQSRLRKQGATKEFRAELLAAVKELDWVSKPALTEDGDGISVMNWSGMDDLIEDMSDDAHTKEVASGDFFPESEAGQDDDAVENTYDLLPLQVQIKLGQIALDYLNEDGDEDAIDEFDPSRTSEVCQVLRDNDDPNWDALKTATYRGAESGASGEAHKLLMDAVEKLKPIKGKLVTGMYTDSKGKERMMWDSPISVVLSLEEAANIVDETSTVDNEYDEIDPKEMIFGDEHNIKIDEPYYGYTDFDDEAAVEGFYDESTVDNQDADKHEGDKPDFDEMPIEDVKAWLESMYSKIPDGFIRKPNVDDMPDQRIRQSAGGLFKTYYG